MNTKSQEYLDLIENTAQKYHETIYSTVSEAEVVYFKSWWNENGQGLLLPDAYIDMIALIDGFDFNGLSFYSIDKTKENNVYQTNEIYWENDALRKYIFVGEDSISWYCIAFEAKKHYILDKPSASVMSEFLCFDDLLLAALVSVI